MERLTIRGHEYKSNVFLDNGIVEAIDKLRRYEDMEEDGLLLKLPIGIGQPCYVIERCHCYQSWYARKSGCLAEKRVQNKTGAIVIKKVNCNEGWNDCLKLFERPFKVGYLGLVGKTVFATKAEAEKALAEMEK